MDDNRYAPPKARVEGATSETATAPALWNPNATANWSLLFTPMFGAWLQMRNWTALGEARRAATSRVWLILSAVVLVASAILDLSMPRSLYAALTTPIEFLNLIAWYFASGRPHAKWVDRRFGSDYPREAWTRPLLWGAAGYAVLFAADALVGSVTSAPG